MISKKQIISEFSRIIGNNKEVTDDTHMDLVGECADYTEILINELSVTNVMPRSLTAENGAKALLIGEFVECFDPDDSGNPYIVPITWDSIKNIYQRIVDHYTE